MNNEAPVLGARLSGLTDVELVRLFLYLGSIQDDKLKNLATDMYIMLVVRGYDPLDLTSCEEDNDIVDAVVDPLEGTVLLSIPQELKIGDEG